MPITLKRHISDKGTRIPDALPSYMRLLIHEPKPDVESDDLYLILGLHHSADADKITLQFKRLSRLYHPDTSLMKDAHRKFCRLKAAYDVLIDPQLRVIYDESGVIVSNKEEFKSEGVKRLNTLFDALFDDIYKNVTAEEGTTITRYAENVADTQDMTEVVRKLLVEGRSKIKNSLEKKEKVVQHFKKMQKRSHRKSGGVNMMAAIAKQRIDLITKDIGEGRKELLIIEEALKMLKDYVYDVEKAVEKSLWTPTYHIQMTSLNETGGVY